MTDRGIKIPVEATDQASPVFARVGQSATKMGQTVTQAGTTAGRGLKQVGTDAKVAQQGLDQVEREAAQAGRSLDDFSNRATAVGAALGTAVTALSVLGQGAVEQTRQIDGIRRAYGDASGQILEFADSIQETTVFSNDAARQAALNASSLAQNYGLTADQIEEVVRVSADLASVYGIELADATQRVAGALRGEGEAAELLGLNMSDAAVASAAARAGLDGWNTTMTEGEKAAFRYTLLIDQAAYATGAAGDAAGRASGQAKQLKNELQDQLQTLGTALGPAAEYASVLGQFAIAAPVVGAGLGRVAGGIQGVTAAAKAGTLATSALAVATGPIGLVAAGVAGVAVLGSLTNWFGLAGDGAEKAQPPIQRLVDTIFDMAQAGADADLVLSIQDLATDVNTTLDTMFSPANVAQFGDRVAQAEGILADLYEANQPFLRNLMSDDERRAIDEQIAAQEDLVASLQRTYGFINDPANRITTEGLASQAVGLLDEALIDSDRLYADLQMRTEQFQSGLIGLDEYNQYLIDIINNYREWYGELPEGTMAEVANTNAIGENTSALGSNTTAMGTNTASYGGNGIAVDENTVALDSNTSAIGANSLGTSESSLAIGANSEAIRTNTQDIVANAEANSQHPGQSAPFIDYLNLASEKLIDQSDILGDRYAAALVTAQDAVIDFIGDAENILPALLAAGRGISGEQGFIRDVLNLERSVNALGQSYDVLIGGTNAIGQQSQQLADWIGGLAVAVDGQSELNRLQVEGRLTTEQVTDAQAANNDILADNHDIQRDILAIQANQAPYLAEINAETAEYVENLRNQDDQQQRNVLTLMDANSQQQLAQLYATATAAATGQLGESGEQFVNDMAAGLRITNPLLYDMLVSTGAIKDDAAGIRFNFDETDAVSLVSVLGELDSTLEDLILVIDELNGKTIAPKVDIPGIPSLPSPVVGGLAPASIAPVPLTVNTSGVSTGVDAAAKIINDGLISRSWVVDIAADNSDAAATVSDTSAAIGDLVGSEYTATIGGDASGALAATSGASAALGAVNGSTATVYIGGDRSPLDNALAGIIGQTIGTTFVRIQGFGDIGFTQDMYRHGGIVGGYDDAAQHGLVTRGMRRVLTDEAGPEIKILPDRTAIIPAPMSSALMRGQGGGKGDIVINGDIHVYESAGNVYDTFQALAYAGSR